MRVLACLKETIPLQHGANSVGRHDLIEREVQSVAQSGRIRHRKKSAVEFLPVDAESCIEVAAVSEPQSHTATSELPVGVVDFAERRRRTVGIGCRLAVLALLFEHTTTEEQVQAVGRVVVKLHV